MSQEQNDSVYWSAMYDHYLTGIVKGTITVDQFIDWLASDDVSENVAKLKRNETNV
jgi:hypothetical protein